MSEHFIQYRFPCDTCLVQAACQDKDMAKEQQLKLFPNRPSMAVPHYEDKTYFKGLIECIINLLVPAMNNISKLEGPEGRQEDDNLPIDYVMLLHTMAQISGYIINSTSWKDGKLHDFDKFEVAQKLSRLKCFM